MDDETLVSELLNGNRSAADAFVARYGYRLKRILFTFHQFPHQDLDDVRQEIFKKIFANDCAALRLWRGTGSLAAYVDTIARRTAIDQLRSRKIDYEVELHEPDHLVGDAVDPQLLTLINQMRRMMLCAIQKLGPPHSEVLTAVAIQGLSYVEAGALLESEPNHIGVRLHHAKVALKRLITREFPALHAFLGSHD